MSTDELARRAARREVELVLRQAHRHSVAEITVPWLTLALAILFAILLLTPKVLSQSSFHNEQEHQALMVKDAELSGQAQRNAGRIDALETRLNFLSGEITTIGKDIAAIKGMGSAFAFLLMLLQVWQIADGRRKRGESRVVVMDSNGNRYRSGGDDSDES